MSGGGGGGGDNTTTVEPWDQAKPHLISAYNRAENFMNQGLGFNPLIGANGVSNFQNTMGFNPGMQGNAYGIAPGALQTGAITGVMPLNADQRAAQQQMRNIAGSDTSGLTRAGANTLQNTQNYGEAVRPALGAMANGSFGQDTSNPYMDRDVGMWNFATGAMNQGANPYFNTHTNQAGFASGKTGMEPNQYIDRTQGALADAAGGKYLNQANANPFMNQNQAALTGTASGQFLGDSNPYLEEQYQAASRGLKDDFKTSVLPALAAQFSGGTGAHGDPLHQYWAGKAGGDLTNELGDMRANMYGNAYGQERDRQMQAANTLQGSDLQRAGLYSNNYNQERQNMLGAANTLQGTDLQRAQLSGDWQNSDLNRQFQAGSNLMNRDLSQAGMYADQQNADLNRQFAGSNALMGQNMQQAGLYANTRDANLNRMLSAGQGLTGQSLAAAGQMPGFDQSLYDRQVGNAQLMGQAGDMDYGIGNQLLGTAQQRYNGLDNEQWNRLNAFSNLVYGNPGSGITSQTGPSAQGNQLAGVAGGALSGAAMGGMMGGVPGMFIGGGLGGLAGFF